MKPSIKATVKFVKNPKEILTEICKNLLQSMFVLQTIEQVDFTNKIHVYIIGIKNGYRTCKQKLNK